MFTVIGMMLSGIGAGILMRRLTLGWIDRLVVYIVWLLLFFLGLDMGGNPDIVSALPTLGLTALTIAITATAGSCLAAAILARWCRLRYEAPRDSSGRKISLLEPLKGSFIILGFFATGVMAGYFGLLDKLPIPDRISFWTLCILIFFIGISIGHNQNIFNNLRQYDRKVLLLPLFTIGGTLTAVTLLALALPYTLTELLAVGSGQGYYSLSSVLIAESKGVELGTIALLANVLREIITLVTAPFLPRIAGPLAPIAAGGATTADSTLPVIRQSCGDHLAVVSVYHGFLVDFSVPFMVALFCSL